MSSDHCTCLSTAAAAPMGKQALPFCLSCSVSVSCGNSIPPPAFLLLNQLPNGFLGFEGLRLARLPAALYAGNWFWLGLPDLSRFSSADYFPLLPWVFLFWCGYFLARCLGPGRLAARMGRAPAPLRPLCAVGRHTLLVYMLHQPVIYGALALWFGLAGQG